METAQRRAHRVIVLEADKVRSVVFRWGVEFSHHSLRHTAAHFVHGLEDGLQQCTRVLNTISTCRLQIRGDTCIKDSAVHPFRRTRCARCIARQWEACCACSACVHIARSGVRCAASYRTYLQAWMQPVCALHDGGSTVHIAHKNAGHVHYHDAARSVGALVVVFNRVKVELVLEYLLDRL